MNKTATQEAGSWLARWEHMNELGAKDPLNMLSPEFPKLIIDYWFLSPEASRQLTIYWNTPEPRHSSDD